MPFQLNLVSLIDSNDSKSLLSGFIRHRDETLITEWWTIGKRNCVHIPQIFFLTSNCDTQLLLFLLRVTHWFLSKWQNVFSLNVGQVGQVNFPPTCLLASSTRLYCPEIIPVLPLSWWQSTPDEGKLPGWEIRWKRELIYHARSRGQVSVLPFMPKYLQIISLSIFFFFNQGQNNMLENKNKFDSLNRTN